MKKETCSIKGCKSPVDIIYYGHGICQGHYDQHCDGLIDLKSSLHIDDRHARIVNKQVIHSRGSFLFY